MGWMKSVRETADSKFEGNNIGDLNSAKRTISKEILQNWFDKKLLNPLDPDVHNLADYLAKTDENNDCKSTKTTNEMDFFRFDDVSFCDEEEINVVERFHLLSSRDNKNLAFTEKTIIPHLERELELDECRDVSIIDESLIADQIDLQRFRGKKYLKKVYDIITNHCENLNRDKISANILIIDDFPSLNSLSSAVMEMFQSKRPLKPTRRINSSRAGSCKINDVANCNIVATVVRATNVPIRHEDLQLSSRKSSTLSTPGTTKFNAFKNANVHPHVFVAISLKGNHRTCRTSSVEGVSPTWNEILTLPFDKGSDDVRKYLSIDLYDEVVEDFTENVTEMYQRIKSVWLGTVKIPIINICCNQRIEGTFEVNVPTLLIGYSRSKLSSVDQQTSINIENYPDLCKKTHISLFISLEPSVEIPQLISSGLECIEVLTIEQHIKQWFEQLKLEFPARTQKWNPLVNILSGRACITRLLHPLTLPMDKNDSAELLIRRFVSLIPIQHDASLKNCSCIGLNGVWLSNNVSSKIEH